jgi:prolipoprotein diacylglyceryltransferase
VLFTLAGIGASVGCIPAGCAYGREVYWTDGWLWSLRADWPDATLINNPRLPTQLCMALWLGVCLCIVWLARTRHWRIAQGGWMLLSWVTLFALGDFIIQFARADAMPMLGPLRISQWADVAFVTGYVIELWIRHATAPPPRFNIM